MNDQQEVQLLPCPWCGNPPISHWVGNEDGGYFEVACDSCNPKGPGATAYVFCGVHGDDEDSCVERWNTRQAALAHASSASAEECSVVGASFQSRVAEWMSQCFIPSLYSNMTERGDRLLEEVLELLQSHGYDPARVTTLVQYVYGRPKGEPSQEVGGVMVTLAGYCWIAGLDMHTAGEAELARICKPEVMAKIRAKQEAKNALHFDTPLPGNAIDQAIAGRRGDGHG